MQVGHFALALCVSTYDWNSKTIVFVLATHMLPNANSLVVKAGFARPIFHCTVTHSIFFALAASGCIAILSPHYGFFALVALLSHYAADIGSSGGIALFWPLSERKFTLGLFKDAGYWGKNMYISYYRQPMVWMLEGTVLMFLVYRLLTIYSTR